MIPKLTNEQLLGEIEELLRTIPSGSSFGTYGTESLSWLGRATAVIEAWDALKGTIFRIALQNFNQRQTTDNLAVTIRSSTEGNKGNEVTARFHLVGATIFEVVTKW